MLPYPHLGILFFILMFCVSWAYHEGFEVRAMMDAASGLCLRLLGTIFPSILTLSVMFIVAWAHSKGLLDVVRAMIDAAFGFFRALFLFILFLIVFYWVKLAKVADEVTAAAFQAQENVGKQPEKQATPDLLSSSAPVLVVVFAIATLVVGFVVGVRWARSTGQQRQLGAHGALPADETSEEHQPPGTMTMSRGPTQTPQTLTPRHGVTGSPNAPEAPRPVRVARLQDGQPRDVSDEPEKSNQELSGSPQDRRDDELAGLRNRVHWLESKGAILASRAKAKLGDVERERDAHAVSLQQKDLEAKKLAKEMSDAQQEYSVRMQSLVQREQLLATRQQEVDKQTEVQLQELRESNGQLIGQMMLAHESAIKALKAEQEDADTDDEINSQLQLAQQTIVNLEAKLADAEAERDRLHDGMQKCVVCKDYTPSLFEDDDDQADSQVQIENLQGQLADLQEKNVQLQEKNSRLASDNTALMTKLANDKPSSDASPQLTMLNRELTLAHANLARYQDKVKALVGTGERRQKEHEKALAEHDSMRAQADAEKEKALAEREEMRERGHAEWNARQDLIRDGNAYVKTHEALKAEHEALKAEHEALKEEHASAQPAHSHLESRVADLESHLESQVNYLTEEGQKVVNAFSELQVTNHGLESQVNRLTREANKFANANRALESRLSDLENRNSQLESQNSQLESQNLALQNSPREFGTNQLILVGTPDDMEISSVTSNEAGISGTMDFAMDVPADIPMGLAPITSMELPPITFQGLEPVTSMEIVPISPIDAPVTSMEIVPISPIDTPINDFDFALAEQENENLLDTNMTLWGPTESLGRENERLQDEVRTMQVDYNRLSEQFECLKSQNEQLKSGAQGSASTAGFTDIEAFAMKKMIDDLQNDKETLEIRINELNGQLQVLQNSRSAESYGNQDCNELKKQLDLLRDSYKTLSEENWRLKTVTSNPIDDSNQTSAAQTTIEDLRGQLNESERMILKLHEDVKNANFRVNESKVEIAGLEAQRAAFDMMLKCDGTDQDCCRTKQREINDLLTENTILKMNTGDAESGTNKACCSTKQCEIDDLKLQKTTLKMNLADAESRLQVAVQENELGNNAIMANNELEKKYDKCLKELEICREQLDIYQQELENCQKSPPTCQKACEQLQLKVDSYKHLVRVMRGCIIECEDSLDQISNIFGQLRDNPQAHRQLKSLLKTAVWEREFENTVTTWRANRDILALPAWEAPR